MLSSDLIPLFPKLGRDLSGPHCRKLSVPVVDPAHDFFFQQALQFRQCH